MNIYDYKNYFFIGVAGSGMSAIAQYLSNEGFNISGSDRLFSENKAPDIKLKLENEGIDCYNQDGSGLTDEVQVVVVSTAIENNVAEYGKAIELNKTIVHRSDLLAAITQTKKTIAISGTSGKSTTVAMVFHILQNNGYSPSLISGAGLIQIQKEGKIGNAAYNNGEWLIIEADESDGTLAKYMPDIGVILNIDKDHKELDELFDIFDKFASQTKSVLIVNGNHSKTQRYISTKSIQFGTNPECHYYGYDFESRGFEIQFKIKDFCVKIPSIGIHNMENALAAIAVSNKAGVELGAAIRSLENYQGIYRRMQFVGEIKGIKVFDDYAHNPAKIAAAISAVQSFSGRVIAWFQPHGYGPTKFLFNEFVEAISSVLRNCDEIWMSEIFYAGGSVVKDISAAQIINYIKEKGKKAFFITERKELYKDFLTRVKSGDTILLMGARDTSLEEFANDLYSKLSQEITKTE